MKRFALLLVIAACLFACSADYDTFGTSDYNNLDDIGFVGQEGSVSVYSESHRIEVKLQELEKGEWDSVALDFFDVSHFASVHLADGKFKEFPSDSAQLDSLAHKVTYSKDKLSKGDKICIPESGTIYLMIVSESGEPSLWQVKLDVPAKKSDDSDIDDDKNGSDDDGKVTSSSSKSKSSSSTKTSKSSSSKAPESNDSDDSDKPESSSSEESADEPGEDSDEGSGDDGDGVAPEIISLSIAGMDAVLDSVEDGDGYSYHFHVDSLKFREDLTKLEVTGIELSEGASCDLEEGSEYDFSDNFTVTVKNGAQKREYTVKAGYQIPGSDFNTWKSSAVSPDSIWNDANVVMTTTSKYTSGNMIGVKMATNETLGKVASGSLYVADFNPRDVSVLAMASSSKWPDGNELINFGRKFAARPEYVEIRFSYEGKGDSCDMYILLENRTGDKNINRSKTDVNKLVASAWYRSSKDDNSGRTNPDVVYISEAKDDNGMRTVRLKFTYGEALEGSPIENSSVFATKLQSTDSKAIDNSLIQGDADELVTHVRVVLASSAAGNFYKGVKGATLIVDDIRLIY